MTSRPALLFALGLLFAAALPVAGAAWRRDGAPRCALDGVRPAAGAASEIRFADGRREVFCGPGCLVRRLATLAAPPARALVVDETTGAAVDAASAWYVESAVISNPANRDRLHAFAREQDARRHAAAHHGRARLGPGVGPLSLARETPR